MDDLLQGFDLEAVSQEEIKSEVPDIGEIQTDLDIPHLKIQSDVIKKLAAVASVLARGSSRDVITKSVALKPNADQGNVVGYATDLDSFLELYMPLQNHANIMDKQIVNSTRDIAAVLKASDNNFTVVDGSSGKVDIKLANGNAPIDNYGLVLDKFSNSKSEFKKVGKLDSQQFLGAIKCLKQVAHQAKLPQERRIYFTKDTAFASYGFACARIKGEFHPMTLSPKDTDVIQALLSMKTDGKLYEGSIDIYESEEHLKFEVPNLYAYSILKSDNQLPEQQIQRINDEVDENNFISVDLNGFAKLVELSATLPNSYGKLELNYTDTGFTTTLKVKGTDSKFEFDAVKTGEIKPLSEPIAISAKMTKLFLPVAGRRANVNFNIKEDSLIMFKDEIAIAIFSEL